MTSNHSRSRRQVLQITGGLAMGALAGCLGVLSGSQPMVIEDVTFEGEQAVVQLADDTNADAIDFRSPSDELLDTASIGRKSKVTFSLYESTNTPYSPGTYRLVAVETSNGGEPQTISEQSLDLTSSFAIADVRPLSEQERTDYSYSMTPPVAGSVQVVIENTGTLPVGIKYIGFPQGVPSPNVPPSEATGLNAAQYTVASGSGRFVDPNSQTTFESLGAPLQYAQPSGQTPDQPAVGVPNQGASWKQIKANHCTGTQHTATLVVVPWQGATQKGSVTFSYGGRALRLDAGTTDYSCTNVTITGMNTQNTSTPTSQ